MSRTLEELAEIRHIRNTNLLVAYVEGLIGCSHCRQLKGCAPKLRWYFVQEAGLLEFEQQFQSGGVAALSGVNSLSSPGRIEQHSKVSTTSTNTVKSI
jgi:hypothetical protein